MVRVLVWGTRGPRFESALPDFWSIVAESHAASVPQRDPNAVKTTFPRARAGLARPLCLARASRFGLPAPVLAPRAVRLPAASQAPPAAHSLALCCSPPSRMPQRSVGTGSGSVAADAGFRGRYGWRWNAHFPRATWGAPQSLEALQVFLVDAPDGADFDAEESPRDEQPPDVGFRRLKRAGGLGNRERTRSVHGLTILARRRNNFFPELLCCTRHRTEARAPKATVRAASAELPTGPSKPPS